MGRSQFAPSAHKLSIKLECTWLTSLSVFGGFWLVKASGKRLQTQRKFTKVTKEQEER